MAKTKNKAKIKRKLQKDLKKEFLKKLIEGIVIGVVSGLTVKALFPLVITTVGIRLATTTIAYMFIE